MIVYSFQSLESGVNAISGEWKMWKASDPARRIVIAERRVCWVVLLLSPYDAAVRARRMGIQGDGASSLIIWGCFQYSAIQRVRAVPAAQKSVFRLVGDGSMMVIIPAPSARGMNESGESACVIPRKTPAQRVFLVREAAVMQAMAVMIQMW